jgi:molybdopterin biosynthesis enzyme
MSAPCAGRCAVRAAAWSFSAPACTATADGSLSAEVLANQSSGAATAFAWGDALVVLDAALDDIPEGTRLPCIRLESL